MTRPTAEWHHGESGPVLEEMGQPPGPEQHAEPVTFIELWEKVPSGEPPEIPGYRPRTSDGQRHTYLADPTPTWTAEPPTEPGWYWCRSNKFKSMAPWVVCVRLGEKGEFVVVDQEEDVWDREISEYSGAYQSQPLTLWHPVPLTPPEAPE